MELRADAPACGEVGGDRAEITCSVQIWMRPHVKVGARYRMEEREIEVDSIKPIGFLPIVARRRGPRNRLEFRRLCETSCLARLCPFTRARAAVSSPHAANPDCPPNSVTNLENKPYPNPSNHLQPTYSPPNPGPTQLACYK
jgi:hypothetical protein